MTYPLKRPFIISCIAAAIGGVIMGFAGTHLYMIGGLGIFGIPSNINPATGLDAFYCCGLYSRIYFHISFWC